MIRNEHARLAARTAVIRPTPSESDLLVLERDDSWEGTQYVVFWLQPAGSEQSVLPPGLERLPQVGEVALSPALVKLRAHEPELARRFPRWFAIGQSGAVSAGELFAYARAPDDPGIRAARSTIRVSAFGQDDSTQTRPLVLEAPPGVPPVALASLALLVIPAAVLAGSAAAGASSIRERRFRVLARLGAPVSLLRAISSLEAATLALPGVVGGLALWLAASHTVATIPGTQRAVFRSDLSLSGLILCGAPFAIVLWNGLVAGFTARVSVAQVSTGRRFRPAWRLTPVFFGAVAAAYGAVEGGYHGRILFLAGALVVLASNVVLAPALVRWAGALLGGSRHLILQFSGRRMEHSPERWARPFVATGTLAVLAFIIVGQVAILDQEDPPRPGSDVSVVTVRWAYQGRQDFVGFRNVLLEPYVFEAASAGPDVRLEASCAELAPLFGFEDCIPGSPYWLSEHAIALLGTALGTRSASVSLVAPQQAGASEAVIFTRGDVNSLHERARTAAMLSLTAPTVVSEVTAGSQPSPLKAWLIAGLALAGLTLGLSAVVTAIDRALGASQPRFLLLKLGVSRTRLRNFESAVFGASFATVVGSSALVGLLMASLMVSQTAAEVPVGAFSWIAAGLAVSGAAGAGLFWAFHRVCPGDAPGD